MSKSEKFSAFHLGAIMFPTVLATGFISLPSIAAQISGNDFWMTGLLASLLGVVTVYITFQLYTLYPSMTVIQYSEEIVGKVLGKFIGFLYFLFLLHGCGITCRQYAEFITGNFLLRTPITVIISSVLLLAAFSIRGGVMLIIRSAVILTPVFIMPLFLLVLLIPDLDVMNIFPILSHGIIPVIKGTIAPQSWVSELFLMSFFLPYLSNPEKGRRWGYVSLFTIIMGMTFVNLMTLLLLGLDTANKNFPLLAAFRYISLGNFFENMEALLLAMWVVGSFIKIGVFYYAAVQSFGQCLQLSDNLPFVIPVGIVVLIFSLWDLPNAARMGEFLTHIIPFEIMLFMTVIPLFLLIIARFFRNRARIQEGKATS